MDATLGRGRRHRQGGLERGREGCSGRLGGGGSGVLLLLLMAVVWVGVHEDLSEQKAVGAETKGTGEHHCEVGGGRKGGLEGGIRP